MLVIKLVDNLRWNTALKLARRGRLPLRVRLDCVRRERLVHVDLLVCTARTPNTRDFIFA